LITIFRDAFFQMPARERGGKSEGAKKHHAFPDGVFFGCLLRTHRKIAGKNRRTFSHEMVAGQCVMPVTHHCCTLEYVCGAVALARYRRPSLGVSSLDWAAHYRAAFFSGQATVCSVDDQDIAQFLLREGWAELPIDVTDQAYVEASELAHSRGLGIWGDAPP
jgi:hypothetical protein